jgi:hypothetical protein
MFIDADYDNNSGNSSNIFFQTKGNPRMTLSGSGNVGIGTTTPTEKLTVVGNISTTSHITASGNISASGKLYGGLASTITPSAVYYNPVGGELSYGTGFTAAGISGSWQSQYFNTVTAAGISGSLGSNAPLIRSLTAAGISGSWQSQPFANLNATAISGSFLLNTTDTFTGQLKVEGSISSSGNIYLGNVGSESSLIFGGQAGDSAKIFTLHNLSQTELIIQTTDDGNDNIRIQTNGWNNANSGSIYLTSEDVNISGRATTGQYVKFDGDNARVGIGTASPGEKLEVVGNISASGTLSAGLTQASGSHITYYNTSSGLFTYEAISEPVDKVRFKGLNLGDTTVEDDGGSTAEFTLSGSTSLGIKVRGDNATSTIGIELSTVSIPEVTLPDTFDNSGGNVFTEDSFIIHDVSAGVVKRIIASNIPVEAFDNSTYTSNIGTITGVTAGTGLGGGGTSGAVTLTFNPGGQEYGVYFNGSNINNTAAMGTPTSNFTFNKDNNDELRVSGDIIAFSSDKRLKENIVVISDPIEKIKQLRGVTYDWKDSALNLGFKTQRQYNEIGLIAQELEKVIPQAVTRAPFDNTDNPKIYVSGNRIDGETDPYKTIKMDKVVPLLIEGIKDQQKQIDELKELVTKLINK